TTIDEVLTRLEEIISDSIVTNNRAGYFAALYYKVTRSVKNGILNRQFEDGPRMEKLDVLFDNRYIEAYNEYNNNLSLPASWKVAFDNAKMPSPLILQHLLLEMNAHINLDLGIAAVEAAKDNNLQNISKDFDGINTVISSLTYQVISELNRVSPL